MNKTEIFLGVLVALMCEFLIIFVNVIPKESVKVEETFALKKVTYRKMITPNSLVKKYNEILVKNNLKEIDLEFLTVIDDTYYIGLYQDIILFITPLECNDFSDDIVYQTGIIVDEETNNFELAQLYYEYLIESNNEYIFNANELVNLVINGELIENNNGLILGAIVSDGEINLFIERKYNS